MSELQCQLSNRSDCHYQHCHLCGDHVRDNDNDFHDWNGKYVHRDCDEKSDKNQLQRMTYEHNTKQCNCYRLDEKCEFVKL